MAQRLTIPRLGHLMTQGIIACWYKEEGAAVKAGDSLYDLEYDKAVETIEAEKDGVLHQLAKEGDTIPVGDLAGVILEAGEDLDTVLKQKVRKAFVPRSAAIPVAAHSMAHATDKAKEEEGKTETQRETAVQTAPKEEMGSQEKDGVQAESYDADLLVIGGGPAGYVSAMRAALRGMQVTLVEKDKLGGTCLNRGCIPTKALLQSAAVYKQCRDAVHFGVHADGVELHMEEVGAYRDKTVESLTKGVASLLKARKVKILNGTASFCAADSVLVRTAEGERQIRAKHVLLATGSMPAMPPVAGMEGKGVYSSDTALFLNEVPKRLAIIGGGVIGVELGSAYAAFGAEVCILEALEEILPGMDGEVRAWMRRDMEKEMRICTGVQVLAIEDGATGKKLRYIKDGAEQAVEADAVIVATGRKACLEGLELEKAGIRTEKGCVWVDENWRTSAQNIYCIGDANGKCMLAHAASAQGIDVVDRILGDNPVAARHGVVPACIYTHPEIGTVGKTEEELKESGIAYKVCRFPMRANGRAMVLNATGGFVKLLADSESNEILGAHIVGPYAAELIGECVLAMELECTLEELANAIHAHPTLSETVMEAAEAGLYGPIHSL